MEQIAIAITGVIAIWLTQQGREDIKKYACLFGLAGQPFWFYVTYQAEQWGIFTLAIFYTYSWLIGLNNCWIKRRGPAMRRNARGYRIGETHQNAKLSDSDVELIRCLRDEGLTYREITEKFPGTSYWTIRDIADYRTRI